MRLVAWILMVLAGCMHAPGQNTFITHLDSAQAGFAGSGRSVMEITGGYLVFGHQVTDNGSGLTKAVVCKLNAQGAFVEKQELGSEAPYHTNFGRFDPVTRLDTNGFAATLLFFGGYSHQLDLVTFNSTGSIVSQSQIFASGDPSDSILFGNKQLRQTLDGGFILCGFRAYGSDSTMAYLAKLDGAGQLVWERDYGSPGQTYEALSAAEYGDGYVVAGYRLDGGIEDLGFLIRTDNAGNQIWRRHYGNDSGGWGAVRVAGDGGIVTFSNYQESDWPLYWYQHLLTKWDTDGDIVWQTHSHYGPSVTAYEFEILPDQRIVTCSRSGDYAALAMYSAAGDSLWSRRFLIFENGFINLPYDVESTSDGGFLLTGGADQYIGDPTPGMETIFIIKTDSLGCVIPGCQNVGVQEYVMDLQSLLRVSPNPASAFLNVALDLPEGGEVQGLVQAQLLDASRRLVLVQEVDQNLNQLRAVIDVSALPAGTYYLHVRDERRWLAGSKVIVE